MEINNSTILLTIWIPSLSVKLISVPVDYSYRSRIITEKNAHRSLCNALDEKTKHVSFNNRNI